MPTELKNIQGSHKAETAESGATIGIERAEDGAAVVSVTYPAERRRRDLKVLTVTCLVLALVPVIVWLIFRNRPFVWFVLIGSAFIAVNLIVTMIRQFLAVTRSYVIRADQTGLTIESSAGRRQMERHFTRDEIADVVLGFSYHSGPYSLFHSWMIIKPAANFSRKIRCLHNLGGDQLARIADALRAALGLPKRSWP